MKETLPSMKEIRAVTSGPRFSEPMRRWRSETHGKIVGWTCSYIPEEIISAGGLLPVRLTGDAYELQYSDAEATMWSNACSYVLTILQLGFNGEYDFLDGVVNAHCCDCIRRFSEMWRYYATPAAVGTDKQLSVMMTLPRKGGERAVEHYVEELNHFKMLLGKRYHIHISNEMLSDEIRTYNRTRRLLRELFEMRKNPDPPITGAESFEIVHAAGRMPRKDYNELLEKLLKEARKRKIDGKGKFRIMLSAAALANPEFIAGIEEQGAIVVVEDHCIGARYWYDLVDEDPKLDPMHALAKAYLNFIPCPRTTGMSTNRMDRLIGLAKEYKVQGVVSAMLRTCLAGHLDRLLLPEKFEADGIPVLELETEYGTGKTGQVTTRVQAFLEMLRGKAAAA
jgi:bzd-type benzoyl-CoA reductase N subunit